MPPPHASSGSGSSPTASSGTAPPPHASSGPGSPSATSAPVALAAVDEGTGRARGTKVNSSHHMDRGGRCATSGSAGGRGGEAPGVSPPTASSSDEPPTTQMHRPAHESRSDPALTGSKGSTDGPGIMSAGGQKGRVTGRPPEWQHQQQAKRRGDHQRLTVIGTTSLSSGPHTAKQPSPILRGGRRSLHVAFMAFLVSSGGPSGIVS